MNSELEYKILFDYLFEGLPARAICKRHAELKDPNGFKSHEIYHGKYKLEEKHKGILFFMGVKKAKAKIKDIMHNHNLKSIDPERLNPPVLDRYRETFVLAKDENCAYYILDGELRNLVQKAYKSHKQNRTCQVKGCKEERLDIAHRMEERKELFLHVARDNTTEEGELNKYDVYNIMKKFLLSHKPKKIYFLCRKHHTQYDNLKKNAKKNPKALREFMKNLMKNTENFR